MTAALPRALCCGACLLFAAAYPALPQAQTNSACSVAGVVMSGRAVLPGVVVTLSGTDAHPTDTTASGNDGLYSLKAPAPGRYTLRAEFIGVRADRSRDRSRRGQLPAAPRSDDDARVARTRSCRDGHRCISCERNRGHRRLACDRRCVSVGDTGDRSSRRRSRRRRRWTRSGRRTGSGISEPHARAGRRRRSSRE